MKRVLKLCENLVLWFLLTALHVQCVQSDPNKYFKISSLCGKHVSNPMYNRVNGALITSHSDKNFECTVTFTTDTVLQRILLRFEELDLDCDHHLYIYDGSYAFGAYLRHLSCDQNATQVGLIQTKSQFVTLKYVTKSFSYYGSGFRLILTSFKEAHLKCKDHKCLNSLCISKSLLCDGINHCGDNSDETSHASCQQPEGLGLTEEASSVDNEFVWIVIIVLLVLAIIGLSLAIFLFIYKRERIKEQSASTDQDASLFSSHSANNDMDRSVFYGQ